MVLTTNSGLGCLKVVTFDSLVAAGSEFFLSMSVQEGRKDEILKGFKLYPFSDWVIMYASLAVFLRLAITLSQPLQG